MHKILLSFLLLLCFACTAFAQVSPKRGMAYGYHSIADMNTVSNGISWWYNWSAIPDDAVKNHYSSLGVEFVPMMWNNNYTVADVIAKIPAGAKYLLAFNEPNFNVEANMTPAQAVAAWPKIEQVAAARNLQIISAAAAYCGGSPCLSGYTSPITWHDEFFSLCPTCKVDYIGFHNYESTVSGLTYLVGTMKKYNRPIWLTEFALWDPAVSAATKLTYLQNAVDAFENDPDVYRYSWFTGRSSANASVSLLGNDGVLTTLGNAYINADYGPVSNIPGKVEVETVYRRKGTGLQTTTDTGGGENVGYTDPGTWNEFLVNVSTTGSYTFKFRIASNVNTGRFNIKVDDQLVKSNIAIPNTGGWQTWTNQDVNGIVIPSGQHLVKFEYTATGTNMNYFTATLESTVAPTADFSASTVSTCIGNQVVFTDQTTNKAGGETYAWNFGAGATPPTATGAGPHTVTYSSSGQKSPSMVVSNANGNDSESKTNYITVAGAPTGCLFADDYANGVVAFIEPVPGAFTHTESGGDWIVSNGGYGEWEYFQYTLNNGSTAAPLNFGCAANKPIVKIRARASANCLLRLTLVDASGRTIDNTSLIDLELTSTYQTFTFNLAGKFRNYNSGNPGVLDSTNITKLRFYVNPGFFSYPITGSNATYNSSFPGTVRIDWIGIGNNCNAPVVTSTLDETETSTYLMSPNPFIENTTLKIPSTNDQPVSIKVVDVQGKTVYASDNHQANETVTLGQGLAAGIYSVVLSSDNGMNTFKIIKLN